MIVEVAKEKKKKKKREKSKRMNFRGQVKFEELSYSRLPELTDLKIQESAHSLKLRIMKLRTKTPP